jgi:hypothetical protein
MNDKDKNLAIFGLGVGAGVCSVYLILELLPLLALGGAAFLIVRGLANTKDTEVLHR